MSDLKRGEFSQSSPEQFNREQYLNSADPPPQPGPAQSSNSAETHKAGYGRPPQESQYKPGQSGNRAGRPKKPKGLNARIREELNIDIPTLIDGRKTLLTQKQAAVRAIIQKAV